ncbi:hypothetical protein LMG27952_06717 [Paraburkholderia hiiakae]|uniref:Uncharacterized protein n=1 Tax=Paraburkholderia hiiakae TaxID=1081782 RepID=A0ABN7ICA6_9BURK|nr:hypothetical protein [Paraburkholderia hiiakae]CAD6558808.1 hypothetical protein LMG27952_06717 [Paraburkholderia hiiakae]
MNEPSHGRSLGLAEWGFIVAVAAVIVAIVTALVQFPPVTAWLERWATTDCAGVLDIEEFFRKCP